MIGEAAAHQRYIVLAFARMTIAALALASAVVSSAAERPHFPDRPVRLVVPFLPGGANDIASRSVANRLTSVWVKPVIIDNRGGANGTIAGEIAAKANPDGYTLFIVSSSIASNVALYKKLPFDLVRDFAPVSALVTGAYALVVNPTVPAASVADFIKLAKGQPRKLDFSSFGEGSSAHLVAELFQRMAGIELVHVPYKGGGPAMAAVVAGEVQMTFSNVSVALAQVKSGKLRALAVSSAQRQPALPNVPSLDESGLEGFAATAWVGLLAPARVPRPVVSKVNGDVRSVLGDAELRRGIEAQGLEPWPSTPEELARHLRTEIARWGKVIREAQIKAD